MEIGDFPGVGISTHTPLARRDRIFGSAVYNFHISTHTPLARRDAKIVKPSA